MAILTLTSDWGMRDHYLASFKGALISRIPSLQIFDISHDIEHYNIIVAAHIVKNAYDKFPPGTIHFIGITSIESEDNHSGETPYIVVRMKGHYLIGEDNGMFNLVIGDEPKEVIRLPIGKKTGRKHLLDSFINTIDSLTKGEFESLGKVDSGIVQTFIPKPFVDSIGIKGTIIFVDSFGNAILNVTKQLFEQERKQRSFTIHFRRAQYDVSEISNNYSEVEVGEIVAFFNQDEHLEIAINKESASQLLGLKLMDTVRIEFNGHTAG